MLEKTLLRVHECTGVSAAWGPGDSASDPVTLAHLLRLLGTVQAEEGAFQLSTSLGLPEGRRPHLWGKEPPAPECGSGWGRGTGGDCRVCEQEAGQRAAQRWEITLLLSPSLCWDAPGLGVSVSVSRSFQSRSGSFSHLDRA